MIVLGWVCNCFLVVVNCGDLRAYGGVRGQFVEGLLWGLFANLYCTTG